MSGQRKETRELVNSKWGDYIRIEEFCDCDDDYLRAIEIVEEHLAGVRGEKFRSSGMVDGTPAHLPSRRSYQETAA